MGVVTTVVIPGIAVDTALKLVTEPPADCEGTTLQPVFTDESAAAVVVAITSSPTFKAYCEAVSQ